MPRPNPLLLRLATIAGVGVLAYSNTFGVPFQFDDPTVLLTPAARDLRGFLASSTLAPRVVGIFSFALDGSLHGGSLAGIHATNLAIHLGVALCVYFLTLFACRRVASPGAPLHAHAPVAALLAGVLFVAHPIQTQAVTYVVQRFSSLAALFYVGAVLAYAHGAVSASTRRSLLLFGSSALLALLGLFTKQHAVTLPLSLAAFDLAILPGSARQRAARLAPFFVVVGLAAVAFLQITTGVQAVSSEYREPAAAPGLPTWVAYLLTQPGVLLTYLRLLVWPAGQNVDHDRRLVSEIASAEVVLPALALALLLGTIAWIGWRARHRSAAARLVLLGLSWFLIALSVECVVPLADVLVEHRMYLPSIGIFLAVAAAGVELSARAPRWRTLLAASSLIAVVALATAAWRRNAVWVDARTLWTDALAKSPAKARPYVYLAQDLLARRDPNGALALLRRAAALPSFPLHVSLNMAAAYRQLGETGRAETLFRDALAQGAASIGAHRGLAEILVETGRVAEACAHVTAGLAFEPYDRLLRDYDGSCRFDRGDVAGAAATWSSLAAEHPSDPRLLYNLALARAALGDLAAARESYGAFLAVAGPELEPQRQAARTWLLENAGGTR